MLSSLRDGVFLTDEGGTVRFWNRAAELITGLTRRDVWGRALPDLPGLGSIAGEIPVGEEETVRPQVFPVQLGLRELWLSLAGVETGEGTVYTFADVTEEQRLEQMKNDFLATVSHELRTPLTGVYGAALTLRERGERLTANDRSLLLASLTEQAEGLTRLVEDLLVASGLESDRLLVAQERFEAVKLAREVVEDARLRNTTARVQLVEAEEAFVLADPARTRQVLENLIDNALKYAGRGPVRVAVEVGEGVVTFGVSDEGPGISEDRRERIFEKFYRSDVQMEGGVGGRGPRPVHLEGARPAHGRAPLGRVHARCGLALFASSSLPFRPDACYHGGMERARVGLNAALIAAGLLLSAFLWLSASGNSPGFLPLSSATARPAEVTLARALPPRHNALAPRRARRAPTNVATPVVAIPVSSVVSISASARPAARHAPAHRQATPHAATPPPAARRPDRDATPAATSAATSAAARSTGDRDGKPRRGCAAASVWL